MLFRSIQNYLEKNPNLQYELQPSGLYYMDVEEGSGVVPVKSDSAWMYYTGRFLTGMIFDSNIQNPQPYGFLVDEGEMIAGIDEAITKMKVGGKAMVLIPSSLAYGSTGDYYGYIGGYTPLLFEIELVRIKSNTAK